VSVPLILLAGGGTGGHVIPAIAVGEEIVRQGGRVRFVGTRDRLEAELVPKAGFEIDFISVRPLIGNSISKKILGVLSLPSSIICSVLLLRKMKPDAVMGVGGYVAGPVVFGAKLLGIPTALLEQNAAVGFTNRKLSKFVTRAFVAYEETVSCFPKGKATWTGNPVKPAVIEAALKKKGLHKDRLHLLVMGGSQGSTAIDDRVPFAIAAANIKDKFIVTHQCGKGNEDKVRAAYTGAGIEAEVVPFIYDTASVFLSTDLVIARSGATTVSELTVMGLPAVFLPYPHHKDRQQEKNAALMKKAGAAVVLDEKAISKEDLSGAIAAFANDADYRMKAGLAASALGKKDAAVRIAEALLSLAGGE
jgi:UDP-N-acetylglucosamine--N-acetylmuramyl-(pentapeptide) pyrophosphoryl-undecaprenol N-acetylglucosamine transferase